MFGLKLLAGGLVFVYLVILFHKIRSAFPLFTLAHLTYYYLFGHFRINVGSINIYGWDVILMFAFINLALRIFHRQITFSPAEQKIVAAVLAYCFYLEISEFYYFLFAEGVAVDNFIRASIINLYPIVAIALVVNLTDEQAFERFTRLLLGAALVITGYMFYNAATGAQVFITSSGTQRYMRGAAVLLVQLLIIYALFNQSLDRRLRLGMLACGTGAVMLIGHRSGFIAMFSIYLAYALYKFQAREFFTMLGRNTHLFALGGVAMIVAALILKPTIIEQFLVRAGDIFDTGVSTTSDRLNKWQVALRSTAENPLGGTKLNLLPEFYGNYVLAADIDNLDIETAHYRVLHFAGEVDPWPPHNIFVNIVSRNGIIGLLLFLMIVIFSVRHVVSNPAIDLRSRYLLLSWILADLIHLQFNNEFVYDASTLFYIALLVYPILYRHHITSSEHPAAEDRAVVKSSSVSSRGVSK